MNNQPFFAIDLPAAAGDDEVWELDSGALVIGEPAPEDGAARLIGTVAEFRQSQADNAAALTEIRAE